LNVVELNPHEKIRKRFIDVMKNAKYTIGPQIVYIKRKTLIDIKLNISLNKQCKLLQVSKSSLYYQPTKSFSSGEEIKLLDAINNIMHP
jgi:hypothetical protein